MRKYICDNCGKEFNSLLGENGETSNLFSFSIAIVRPDNDWGKSYHHRLVEVCQVCRDKIEKIVKAGVN